MVTPTRDVSEAGLFVFKEQYEHLKFLKRQQWTITNYVALIYAAIFSVMYSHSDHLPLPSGLIYLLKVAAIGAFGFGLWHLIAVECSMLQTRDQIGKSIQYIFGPYEQDAKTERAQIAGPDDAGSFFRDLPFLLALVAVLVVGAVITVVW